MNVMGLRRASLAQDVERVQKVPTPFPIKRGSLNLSLSLREKYQNMEFFLVRIFQYIRSV